MFGFGFSKQGSIKEIFALTDQAQSHMGKGENEQACHAYQSALIKIRELMEKYPNETEHLQSLASVHYTLAGPLNKTGRYEEALSSLRESEQAYRQLEQLSGKSTRHLVADVLCRIGLTESERGFGISAILNLDEAFTIYRELVETSVATYVLDYARVLTGIAQVQFKFGDADLAVASADTAIKIYLTEAQTINASSQASLHSGYLLSAASVASEVHALFNRTKLALSADDFAIHTAQSLAPRGLPSDKENLSAAFMRKHLHLLSIGEDDKAREYIEASYQVDACSSRKTLDRWENLGRTDNLQKTTLSHALEFILQAREIPAEDLAAVEGALTTLTRPATDLEMLSQSDRISPPLLPTCASLLQKQGKEILHKNPLVAGRLCWEAQCLFALASREQTAEMRYQLAEFGPAWRQAIDTGIEVSKILSLAELQKDLEGWQRGLQNQLPLEAAVLT